MKKQKTLWNGVSKLIVAILAIMAFIPKSIQVWFYLIAFTVFGVWSTVKYLIPYIKEGRHQRLLARFKKRDEAEGQRMFSGAPAVYNVLLKHANYRITGYIKSAYPDATWNWCEERPELIVAKGGKGKIRVYGVKEYNYGEVTFDQNGNMKCALLKVVELGESENSNNSGSTDGRSRPNQNFVDPQIWYDQQGREVLERLISELNTYGHRRLTIRENGDVSVLQADREITKRQFASVPEKMYWNRLAKIFERAGMASEVHDDGIVVTW